MPRDNNLGVINMPKPGPRTTYKYTDMLVAAVDTDNLKLVSVLIDLDADINKRITSISPISKKVYRKENPKLKDSSGFTALDHAKQLFAEDPDKGIGFELEIENIIEYLSSVT